MMFVSSHSGGGGSIWNDAAAILYPDPSLFAAAAAAAANTTTGGGEKQRSTAAFYISDLLYPSVIPLPGTLPHSPPPPPPSPPRSRDLKFGIDRILHNTSSNAGDRKRHKPAVVSPPHSHSSPPPSASPPTSITCPCSSPSCLPPPAPRGVTHLYTPLPYPMGRLRPLPPVMPPTPAHPGLYNPAHRELPPTAFHHHHRHTAEYPGPYSMLTGGSGSEPTPQSPPKRKRSWSRAVFSSLQRKGLEKRFEVQKYVTKPDRRQLAAMLGLTDAQVKVWFQNRRMKWRHAEEQKKKREAAAASSTAEKDTVSAEGEPAEKHGEEEDDEEISVDIDVESCQESDDDDDDNDHHQQHMALTLDTEKVTS